MQKLRLINKSNLRFIHSTQSIKYKSTQSTQLYTTNEIRDKFLKHFCDSHNHKFIASSSVIPRKGSGTYFTNAGMNQFKQIILGELNANDIIDPSKYRGVANSQKCIRIGGKHSDLDSIGKDDYHHTFFEMLGNWSFGSYGKEDACKLALELLVDTYKLNANKLYFTYFSGNKELNLEPDFETKKIWQALGIKESRILPFGMRENFWEMDVQGPCGPCTEIHYDRTNENAAHLVNAGDERVIELWNLVFMQYNRLSQTNFIRLPNMVVDTGMGLERITAVLNNFNSNYQIDIFADIFKQIESYLKDCNIDVVAFSECSSEELKYAYRSISDHMRTITVSISDGLVPSRSGLGAYLKYLILKCIKISREIFNVKHKPELFLNSLVPVVVQTLCKAYPALATDAKRVQEVIESTALHQDRKIKKADETIQRFLKKLNNPKVLNAKQVWNLYKGDGSGEDVPFEFIEEFATKNAIEIDKQGFEQIYLDETETSLRNLKNNRMENTRLIDLSMKLKKLGVASTDDSLKYEFKIDSDSKKSKFQGKVNEAKILSTIKIDENNNYEIVECLKAGDKCILLLDKTMFYAEQGGQDSDTGFMTSLNENEIRIDISNVQYLQNFVFHFGTVTNGSGEVKQNDKLKLFVDEQRRFANTTNHTGIHVLNHALRSFYNDENSIIQVNSSAKEKNLRLEFLINGKNALTPSDVKTVQEYCQEIINKDLKIYSTVENFDDIDEKATKIPLRKLRDILYPRNARVVSIGDTFKKLSSPGYEFNKDYSSELCCGNHADSTKQLESFAILSFSKANDAYYEIEACTASTALDIHKNDKFVQNIYEEILAIDQNTTKGLHEVARKSTEIELFSQKNPLSFFYRNKLKNDMENYRPSKYKLQKVLKKSLDSAVQNWCNSADNVNKTPVMEFESILDMDQTIALLKKYDNIQFPILLLNIYKSFAFAVIPVGNKSIEDLDKLNYGKTAFSDKKVNKIYSFKINEKLTMENLLQKLSFDNLSRISLD